MRARSGTSRPGANRLVRDLIARHRIDCDLTDGYLECCWRAREADEAAAHVDHLATHYGHTRLRVRCRCRRDGRDAGHDALSRRVPGQDGQGSPASAEISRSGLARAADAARGGDPRAFESLVRERRRRAA